MADAEECKSTEDGARKGARVRLSDERRAQIIELIGQGLSAEAIMKQLSLSESVVLRFMLFAKVHGVDELRAMPSLIDDSCKATPTAIAKMVEFAICYNIPSYMMEIFFKFRNTILRTCIDIRRTIGHALVPNPQLASLPKSVDQAYFAEYVAKHNGGKTPEDMLKQYLDELELSEDGVEYIEVRKASDFRRYTRCKKSEIAPLVQKYRQQGMSITKIATLIGYEDNVVSNYLNFIDIHGFDEALRCEGVVDPTLRSKYERACMVEFIIAYNYPRSQACLLFKVSEDDLRYLYTKRIEKGVPLYGATIARIPDTADVNFVTSYIAKLNTGKSIDELKDDYLKALQEQRSGDKADAQRDALGASASDADVASRAAARAAASAEAAGAGAGRGDAADTKRAGVTGSSGRKRAAQMSGDERIQELAEAKAKEMVEAAAAEHAKAMAEAVEQAWQEGRKAGCLETEELLTQLYAAGGEVCGDYADTAKLLKALFDYDAGVSVQEFEQRKEKNGRPPKVNIFDPNFEKLDESIKLSQYSRFVSDLRNLLAVAHKQREIERKAVGKTLFELQSSIDTLKVAAIEELKQSLPVFNQAVVWSAMGYRDLNVSAKLESIAKRAERDNQLMEQVTDILKDHHGPLSVSQLNNLLIKKFGKGVSEARLKLLMQSLHILPS